MIIEKYADIVSSSLLNGAIENNRHAGFREDYHVLHCLIRKYKPKTFLEIGTDLGYGTSIICNAGQSFGIKVYTLDLPPELAHMSKQYPKAPVGSACKFPFTQIWADSLWFDYGSLCLEGWFIDGEHDYIHAYHESQEAIKSGARLIVYHDADIREVWLGVCDAYEDTSDYTLHRVIDTRIAYLVRK